MIKNLSNDTPWNIIKNDYIFKRPWLTVRRDCVELPNGHRNPEFYVQEFPDWVNVIALTEDDLFVFEKQYRHGLRMTGYELCAGVIEEGESPLEAAKRELQEETGYGEGEWEEIMQICANPSITNNITHCFLAKGVKKISGQNLDYTEDITPILLSEEQVREILDKDICKQALMAAPLWKYFAVKDSRRLFCPETDTER